MAPNLANAKVPVWIDAISGNNETNIVTDRSEITCMALAIYYEARGESVRGQRAVGEVLINRTKSGRFPATVCGVLMQRGQFSFVRNGAIRQPKHDSSWEQALSVAKEILSTRVATNKWLYFCNCGRSRGMKLGNHIFF